MTRVRTLEELQEDIRTLRRVPSVFIDSKLNELADELAEHDKQIRAEAIDKFMEVLCEDCKKQPCYGNECYQKKIAKQLKKEV